MYTSTAPALDYTPRATAAASSAPDLPDYYSRGEVRAEVPAIGASVNVRVIRRVLNGIAYRPVSGR